MTAWHAGRLLGFDTESTGVDVETDRIVTATTVRIDPGRRPVVLSHLIAVDIDIPEAASNIHGISTEHARRHGRPAPEVLDLVAGELAVAMTHHVPAVAYNAPYDFTILDRECRRLGLPTVEERLGRAIGPVIDPFVLDKHLWPRRKGPRKLINVAEAWRVPLSADDAHDATADALAACRIAWRIGRLAHGQHVPADFGLSRPGVERLAALANLSLGQLHQMQQGWRREQCDSLRAYFDREGKDHDGVPGTWPIHPWQPAAPAAAEHKQEAMV